MLGEEPGGLLAQLGEHAEGDGAAEQVGEGRSLLVAQRDRVGARVRIDLVEERELAGAVAVRDDADASAVRDDDVVAHADAGKVDFLDSYGHEARLPVLGRDPVRLHGGLDDREALQARHAGDVLVELANLAHALLAGEQVAHDVA